MRIAYLQFDGVTEESNAHRKVGNLFDVKLRAIENLHAAGIDVCLVVTIVNTVNNDQVGPIVKFALQNCDKISFVSFQPVAFTGARLSGGMLKVELPSKSVVVLELR